MQKLHPQIKETENSWDAGLNNSYSPKRTNLVRLEEYELFLLEVYRLKIYVCKTEAAIIEIISKHRSEIYKYLYNCIQIAKVTIHPR